MDVLGVVLALLALMGGRSGRCATCAASSLGRAIARNRDRRGFAAASRRCVVAFATFKEPQPDLADRRIRRHRMPQGLESHLADHRRRGGVEQLGDARADEGRTDERIGGAVHDELRPTGVVVAQQGRAPPFFS